MNPFQYIWHRGRIYYQSDPKYRTWAYVGAVLVGTVVGCLWLIK